MWCSYALHLTAIPNRFLTKYIPKKTVTAVTAVTAVTSHFFRFLAACYAPPPKIEKNASNIRTCPEVCTTKNYDFFCLDLTPFKLLSSMTKETLPHHGYFDSTDYQLNFSSYLKCLQMCLQLSLEIAGWSYAMLHCHLAFLFQIGRDVWKTFSRRADCGRVPV